MSTKKCSQINVDKAEREGQLPDPLHAKLGKLLEQWNLPHNSLRPYSEALTHASYTNEVPDDFPHNERLEFLGDAVIELVVSSLLYARFPEASEGVLTRLRAELVCTPSLAQLSADLGLAEYVLMGKGEEEAGGRTRPGFLADVFEAFCGAIYLDTGLQPARDFISAQLSDQLTQLDGQDYRMDAKGQLQSWSDQGTIGRLDYRLVREEGPDHDKHYAVEVLIDGTVWGSGQGSSKKQAQKSAARTAVKRLREKGIVDSSS